MEATGGIEEEMDLEIHSSHFYSKGTTRQEGSEVYEVFSRQEHAFQFFDSFVEGNKRDKNDDTQRGLKSRPCNTALSRLENPRSNARAQRPAKHRAEGGQGLGRKQRGEQN